MRLVAYSICLIIILAGLPALADTPQTGSPDEARLQQKGDRAPFNGWLVPDAHVWPVQKGYAAPFSGFLVPESRFRKYLEQDIELLKFKGLANTRLEALKNLGNQLVEQENKSWFRRNSFTLGMATGIALSVGLVYGTARLYESVK